jgi:ankyrin repeat protein
MDLPESILASVETTMTIQSCLFNLTSDTFAVTLHKLLEWSDDSLLIRTVFSAVKLRPLLIPILSDLMVDYAFQKPEFKAILIPCFFRYQIQSSANLFFLFQLHQRGLIPLDDIFAGVRDLDSRYRKLPQVRVACLLIIAWFAPEASVFAPDLWSKSLSRLQRFRSSGSLPDSLELFCEELPQLKANDWELFRGFRSVGYNHNGLSEIIRKDDIDRFIDWARDSIDQQLPDSIFERCDFLQEGPHLVHAAAFHGSSRIFKYLMLNQVRFDLKDKMGMNVTFFAVAGGSCEIIRILRDSECSFSRSPRIAAAFFRPEIFDWIVSQIYDDSEYQQNVICAAAAANNVDILLRCFENGADVNVSNPVGRTGLHLAAEAGAIESLQLLLAHPNVRVDAVDNDGSTALHLAARQNNWEIVRILLAVKPEGVNCRDREGKTALIVATELGHVESVVELLQAPCVDVNVARKDGSVLHLSVSNLNLLKLFLNFPGINLNATDAQKLTALHLCAIRNLPETGRILCSSAGIDVNCRDAYGETALSMAIGSSFAGVARAILANPGTALTIRNSAGKLPAEFAADIGDPEVMTLFTLSK